MIYLYAITEPEADVPDLTGLDDQPLDLLNASEVAGLYSRHDRASFDPDPDALWRHDQVVESAMRCGPVLPARFATTFTDTAALATALVGDQSRLRRQMERVRGCVELAVRVLMPAAPASVPDNGSDYLRTKLGRQQERRAVAEQTLIPLVAHAVCSRGTAADPDRSELTASYLVRAGEVDQFADRVRLLAGGHSELSLSCTGPWPPYSFVGEEGEE